jgi:hypothetical protein
MSTKIVNTKRNFKTGPRRPRRGNNKPKPVPQVHYLSRRRSRPASKKGVVAAAQGRVKAYSANRGAIAKAVGFDSKAKRLAMGICNPMSVSNLRFSATPQEACSTGVTALHYLQTEVQPSTASTYTDLTAGVSFVALFRDALRAMVILQPNPSNTPYQYDAVFYSPSSPYSTSYFISGANYDSSSQIHPLWWVFNSAPGTFDPHQGYLFPGATSRGTYVWVDYGASITFTQATADTTAYIDVDIWSYGEDFTDGSPLTFTTSTILTYTPGTTQRNGVYASFTYTNGVAVAGNHISIKLTGAGDVMGHWSVPEAKQHLLYLDLYRVNAASLMVSNCASDLTVNGTIDAAYLEPEKPFMAYTSADKITKIGNNDISRRKFKNGCYAFLKPSNPTDLNYRDGSGFDALSNPTHASFPLEDGSRYLVMLLVTQASGGVSTGLDFYVSFEMNLEFQTTDPWPECHLSNSSYQEYIAAMNLVKTIPMFHDNPLHYADIMSGIRQGYNWARGKRSPIATALAALFPQFGGAAAAGERLLGAMPEW